MKIDSQCAEAMHLGKTGTSTSNCVTMNANLHICTAHVNIVYECMNGFKNSLPDLTRGDALVHQPLPRRPSIDLAY